MLNVPLPDARPAGSLVVAGTGHRPERLHASREAAYAAESQARLVSFARRILAATPDIALVRSGMALGWDQALATAAIDLGLPWEAYVPFVGQAGRWPVAARRQYIALLSQAQRVPIITPGRPENAAGVAAAMTQRNAALITGAGVVLALWDGGRSGTGDAVARARAQGLIVRNYWGRWLVWRDTSEPRPTNA